MPISTLASKGQITVPKPIRKYLHVTEGDQVDFSIAANGDVTMRRIRSSVADLAGVLHHPTRQAVSLNAMNDAIAVSGRSACRGRPA